MNAIEQKVLGIAEQIRAPASLREFREHFPEPRPDTPALSAALQRLTERENLVVVPGAGRNTLYVLRALAPAPTTPPAPVAAAPARAPQTPRGRDTDLSATYEALTSTGEILRFAIFKCLKGTNGMTATDIWNCVDPTGNKQRTVSYVNQLEKSGHLTRRSGAGGVFIYELGAKGAEELASGNRPPTSPAAPRTNAKNSEIPTRTIAGEPMIEVPATNGAGKPSIEADMQALRKRIIKADKDLREAALRQDWTGTLKFAQEADRLHRVLQDIRQTLNRA